ncbi:alpha-hydroxy acid oxidase [Aestuariivita boseongensis]|uniref:alpha-hydroxy acid oxidase n=1 Tax=Aestuariivita boseongensis TaxID=1470562 RepID=UPI0006828DBF|nr:alpha-hydroxy acid oxidase [Aestuariivita boseongensis]
MDLDSRYPGLTDLKQAAQRRLPKFVWEYLDSGTGSEATKARNRVALDAIGMMPSILHGEFAPDLSTTFLGQSFPAPFGIAPVGMSGLIWADAEGHLARSAARNGIPYCMSTAASQSPEDITPALGAHGWYQLYPPRDEEIRRDMLARARDAGFTTLVLTVDVPVASRRERQTRSGLRQPPKLTPRLMAQVAIRPAWALTMARRGMPWMRTFDKYAPSTPGTLPPTAHVGYLLRTSPDRAYLDWLRREWDGPLIVKGVLRPEDCAGLEEAGVNAIWVSNHAGRQFDGAPAAIDMLPLIREASALPLIFDSGVEGGLDILRALTCGADFVMLGRAWHFALAALGPQGPDYLFGMLCKDMISNMGQLGARNLREIPKPVALG